MVEDDFDEVAELIYLSTNSWYREHLGISVFSGLPEECRIFCEVYEDLDPGCGLVMENDKMGTIVGSCFYHARETHMSLGIMNVHPNYFGHGIAGRILRQIIALSEEQGLPLRLISSAINLDSFSLYSRHGFKPMDFYQDMLLEVPNDGLPAPDDKKLPEVRLAEPSDLVAMGQLEFEVSGISREKDYCYFIENSTEIWQTVVSLDSNGEVDGFLVSIDHPATRMIGPGVSRTAAAAEAMLRFQCDRYRGRGVVFVLPASFPDLVASAYRMGAKNCELHLTQVRGQSQPVTGIVIPCYLPESG